MTIDLDRLEALVAKMTPGEWVHSETPEQAIHGWSDQHVLGVITDDGYVGFALKAEETDDGYVGPCAADCAGLAALRNAAPELIRLARQAARLRAIVLIASRACDLGTGEIEDLENAARAALAQPEPAEG